MREQNTYETSIESIESSDEMSGYKHQIKAYEALKRLFNNDDFKMLFLTDYLEDEAVRLVHARGYISPLDTDKLAGIDKEIQGIGTFKRHLDMIRIQAEQAEMAIQEFETYAEEARSNGKDTVEIDNVTGEIIG